MSYGITDIGEGEPHEMTRMRAEGNNTLEEQAKARRYVAAKAEDAVELRELLMMLGLLEPDFRWVGSTHPRRKETR